MTRTSLAALLSAAFICLPAAAAPLGNGSFADGLTGWDTLGDAGVEAGRLWLSNASLGYVDDAPLPAGALNRSGSSAVETWDGAAEAFAGLAPGALGADAYEGSFVRQSFFTGEAGLLSFRWNLSSNDSLADLGFIAIDGQVHTLAVSGDALAAGTAPFAAQTGERLAQFVLGAGTHTIAFGVVDVGDASVTSALSVADVQVTPVPEPGALALMLAGLVLVAAAGRRSATLQEEA